MASAALHHIERGQGDALVLLHPIGLDHSFWPGLIERCAAARRVLALDLPGHGRSPAAPDATMTAYVEAVKQTLDALAIEKATVLGLSFGGMIAQELAIRFPNRVSRLIACACGARIPPEARETVAARGQAALDGGMSVVVDGTLQRWFTPSFMGDPAVAKVRDRLLSDDPQQWNAGWRVIATHDALDRLPKLAIPTLVVAGEVDLGTPVPAARAIAEVVPGARLVVVPAAPHMLQIECAETFVGHIAAFLEERS
jgi:3-oxoadipate enol-lactonase